MTIAAWLVVDRRQVVHAYKPGGLAATEGPFRTLGVPKWASSGVRLTRRAGGRLAGQMTVFSSLNVDSARLGAARESGRGSADGPRGGRAGIRPGVHPAPADPV
jgi:hypothetical protein